MPVRYPYHTAMHYDLVAEYESLRRLYTINSGTMLIFLSHDLVSFLADGGCGTGWVNVCTGGFILAGSGLCIQRVESVTLERG